MPEPAPTAPAAERPPFFSYNPIFIGLRYLLRKKLSYLAIFGVALSVGTLIVVMSVFTGFQLQLTSVMRGYLSDVTIQPALVGEFGHGLGNWSQWRQQVLGTPHVEGVTPFLDSIALLRLPGQPNFMSYVQVRGVDPDLEGNVSKLPQYMRVGTLQDLKKVSQAPDGGSLRACFVGSQFPGIEPAAVRAGTASLILITATKDLERVLAKFAVTGTFATGNYEYDSKVVIMSLDSATDFAKSGGAVTGLNVRLDDYHNADAVRGELMQKFQAGRMLHTYGDASTSAQAVALSGDAARLSGVTRDGDVIVWDVATGKELRRVPATDAPATSAQATAAALSGDGALLLVGRADGSAALLKTDSGEEVRSVRAADSPVTAACFSPDDRYFALGCKDGSAGVWEPGSAAPPVMFKGHTAAVNDVAFRPDGEQVATASEDATGCVWDVASGKREQVLPAIGKAPVTAVAFDPNGDKLLLGQANGVIALWDPARGPGVTAWPTGGAVRSILFGPAANALMSASADAVTGWVMDTVNDRPGLAMSVTVAEPAKDLRSVAFCANGQSFVSVAADGQPRLRYSGPRFSIKTWQEHDVVFMEAVAMERFLQALILSLILVLAEFFVFALVFTMVTEKRRDIGIMKAVGFTSRQVSAVFMVIGLSIGVFGGLLGVGGGLLFAHYINPIREFIKWTIGFDPFPSQLYYFTEVPSHVTLGSVLAVGGGAIICALLFSIVPAIHAARMDPVRTLHYE